MTRERPGPHVHALPDGRVLVIGDDTSADIWDPATGSWHATASLNNPRTQFISVLLSDGRVLVAGGLNDIDQSYSSAYLFDPATEAWTKTSGLMVTARTGPSAAVLPDGRVLVAGGYFHQRLPDGRLPGGNSLAGYHPPSASSRPGSADIAPPPIGAALATAEIFDPATGQWSTTGPMRYARYGAPMVPLADGRVLVVGSLTGDTGVEVDQGSAKTAEIYDPATGQFALTGGLPAHDFTAIEALGFSGLEWLAINPVGSLVPLPDGGAVLAGHSGYWKHLGEMTRSLRFDGASGSWSEIGEAFIWLADPGTGASYQTQGNARFDPAVAVLPDGRVIVAGGRGNYTNELRTLASAELYDPTDDTWTALPDMPEPRGRAGAATLGDGSVMLAGGHFYPTDDTVLYLASTVRLTFAP